jgi:hypothetical protein
MFILDLDMKILVFEILGDNLYLLLFGELGPYVYLPTKVVIFLCSKY